MQPEELKVPDYLADVEKEIWNKVVPKIESVRKSDILILEELCKLWVLKDVMSAKYYRALKDKKPDEAKNYQGLMMESRRDVMKILQYFADRSIEESGDSEDKSINADFEALMGVRK